MSTMTIQMRRDGHPHTPFSWHHAIENPQRCDGDYFMCNHRMDIFYGVCSCTDDKGHHPTFYDAGFVQ